MAEPASLTTIGLIGFVLSVVGTLQSGLFMYNAIVSMGAGLDEKLPPKHWGKPWQFWLTPGMDGAYDYTGDPVNHIDLEGAGGPVPYIHIFNRAGEYLGTPKDKTAYAKYNRFKKIPVYPISVQRHEGQNAQFVILASKPHDALCIADLGLGLPEGGQFVARPWVFSALTAQACGAPWYHSGIIRDSTQDPAYKVAIPCFWLGGHGLLGMQIHLPSHSAKGLSLPIGNINQSEKTIHEYACNHPAVLSFWSELPEVRKIPRSLMTDLTTTGNKTLNYTRELRRGKAFPNDKLGARSTNDFSVLHENTITIAHEDRTGLSAIELCSDGMSRGPDYVNIAEGKFCRMADKTLWPICGFEVPIGPQDNCFNVETKQLVVGGKVKRTEPYAREVHYPLKD